MRIGVSFRNGSGSGRAYCIRHRAPRPPTTKRTNKEGTSKRATPQPHLKEGRNVRGQQHIDVESRMLKTHRHVVVVQDHPKRSGSRTLKVELHDDLLRGERIAVDASSHPPEEQDRVEVGRIGLAEGPASTPDHQGIHKVLKLPPCQRELVVGPAPAIDTPLEDAGTLQPTEALRQKRTGDSRETAFEIVEVADTAEEVPDVSSVQQSARISAALAIGQY